MDNHVFNCAFTAPLIGNLECSICKSIMMKPVTLPCGHSACRNCYTRLLELEEQKNKTKALCPECRSQQFGREALTVSYAMDRIITSLEVQCLNKDCGWKGQLGEAEDHNRQCPSQAKLSCPLGCNEKLLWSQVAFHMSSCPLKIITCQVTGCNLMFQRAMWEDHMVSCALTHSVLYEGEIRRLRHQLSDQKRDFKEAEHLREENVFSFTWRVDRGNVTVASKSHRVCNTKWRGVRKQGKIFLQLESSVNPQKIKASIILMPGKKAEVIGTVPITDIKEGEMVGNVPEDDKTRNGQPSDQLIVNFFVTTFVHI